MFRDPLVQKAWEIRHQAEQFPVKRNWPMPR
jgi:hypothetical protein